MPRPVARPSRNEDLLVRRRLLDAAIAALSRSGADFVEVLPGVARGHIAKAREGVMPAGSNLAHPKRLWHPQGLRS